MMNECASLLMVRITVPTGTFHQEKIAFATCLNADLKDADDNSAGSVTASVKVSVAASENIFFGGGIDLLSRDESYNTPLDASGSRHGSSQDGEPVVAYRISYYL